MNLKKRLGSSTLWMSLAASGNSIVSFIIFIVLSRILAPAEIGLVAFALLVVEIGKILVNAGFAQAIVQHPQFEQRYASTCFFANLCFALLVTLAVIFIAAPLIAHFYQPKAGEVLVVLSAIFFIEGAKAVHEGKLKREFAFNVIALRTIAAGLTSGALGIYLAIQGYGVWALVCQQLMNQFITSLVTIICGKWMPSWTFSWIDFKQLLKFSSPLMMAQLIGNISTSVFEFLVGIILGPAALGFYRVGGRALYILQEVVLKPFEYTALSALSRLETPQQQAQGTLRMLRMSTYLTLPIFFGAAAVAPEFIALAFGDKWQPSGNLMSILALGIAPMIIGYHTNAALTASNNAHYVMFQAAAALVLSIGLGAISIPQGLTATAIAFAVRNYLLTGLQLYFFNKKFQAGWINISKAFLSSGIASWIMFFIVYQANRYLSEQLHPALNILVLCTLGGLVYLCLMTTAFRKETKNFFKESLDLAPMKIKPIISRLQGLIKLS